MLDEHSFCSYLTPKTVIYTEYAAAHTVLSRCHFSFKKSSEFKVRLLGLKAMSSRIVSFYSLVTEPSFSVKDRSSKFQQVCLCTTKPTKSLPLKHTVCVVILHYTEGCIFLEILHGKRISNVTIIPHTQSDI